MESVRELLEEELKDAYDFEHRLVDALGEMATKVTDEKLKSGFERHRLQTERQIHRLGRAFDALGASAERSECAGIKGLVSEFKEFIEEESPSDEILNIFAASAAEKTEHYEIVHYEGLIKLADKAGFTAAIPPLQENLAEELATADELKTLLSQLAGKAAA